MELKLENYSHRSGEEILSKSAEIRKEIESVLFQSGTNILTLSGDEYAEAIRNGFLQRGWENQPTIMDGFDLTAVMDFRKDRVGIRLGLESSSSPDDMQGFQIARKHPETEIDMGVYVTTIAESQQFFQETSGKSWAGPNFDMATKGLRQMQGSILVPVCVVGVGVREDPLKSIDLNTKPTGEIKELVLAFIESEYDGIPVIKNVRVQGKTDVLEFDGITRIEGKDVILALEVDGVFGVLTPWLEPDHIRRLVGEVREYQEISERDVCLRFVLVGDFKISFIDKTFGDSGILCGLAEGIAIDYEVRSFEEFEIYLATH